MEKKQFRTISVFKKMNAVGVSIGIVFFIISLFASGSNLKYLLASFGIAIIFCSIAMFIFGLFLSLMGEYTENRKVKA
jgi:hypothetical protein